jgi:hypothetical protein
MIRKCLFLSNVSSLLDSHKMSSEVPSRSFLYMQKGETSGQAALLVLIPANNVTDEQHTRWRQPSNLLSGHQIGRKLTVPIGTNCWSGSTHRTQSASWSAGTCRAGNLGTPCESFAEAETVVVVKENSLRFDHEVIFSGDYQSLIVCYIPSLQRRYTPALILILDKVATGTHCHIPHQWRMLPPESEAEAR